MFLTGNTDWYRSNGSILWAANSIATNGVVYNGGTRYLPLTNGTRYLPLTNGKRYLPLTNGKRNDCFERFFITVSPRYEEMLPNIPNPPSPWRHITGTRLWRAHGASNREQDRQYWANVHRHGQTQMVVTDHEGMWRDEGESFTFRTKAAPGKGGDPGAYDYARFMQDQLGFNYGPYNNYTDFAPVNEFWSPDMVSRDPQNQLQHAWMRCYAPKPARAIEYCAKLAPQIQAKFKFSTAYCDVHTAVAPWDRVDYDPRVPGAGTLAAVFYPYGEIMLRQKRAWNGPVYSEGNYHSFYMGLTDGNYGQDQSYRPAENPWLVDFDLRKMHDLGCNFGMGDLGMFYANAPHPRAKKEDRDAELDRFLAATVAFGHPGFLVMEGGMGNAARSYFMLQQLHSRYCLTNASDIRYADAGGALLDTSRAVASGAYRRSQVVTRYADGTVMDILIAQLGEGVQLLHNDMQTGHWLKVRLRSRLANGTPLGFGDGPKVIAHLGDLALRRTVSSVSFLSQSSHTLHFGLGDAKQVDRLEVRWSAGATNFFTNLEANATWELTEGETQAKRVPPERNPPSSSGPSKNPAASSSPAPADKARLVEFWNRQRAAMNAMKVEKDNPKAIQLFRAALELNPQHEDSRYYLGTCLASQGDVSGALAELAELIRINPSSHRGHQQWGTLRALFATNDVELLAAENSLETAHALNPEETGALLVLGEIALLRGDVAKANERLTAACRTNPRVTGGFFLRGYLAWKTGDALRAPALLAEARGTLGKDWQPKGTTAEGDVQQKQHVETTPLSRFWERWDGLSEPGKTFATLDNFLKSIR